MVEPENQQDNFDLTNLEKLSWKLTFHLQREVKGRCISVHNGIRLTRNLICARCKFDFVLSQKCRENGSKEELYEFGRGMRMLGCAAGKVAVIFLQEL